MDIKKLTACQIAELIKTKEITVKEVVEKVFSQIEKNEKNINSLITVCEKEKVLQQAEEIQKLIDEGNLDSPIAGVPMVVKDNICTKGILTTCGSKILENYIPTYSAEAVERLEKAGAIIIGKGNMDEFGMGSTSEASAYGPVKNPCNLEHVPGGSSGGSAAGVAAGYCGFALGSDTGGSIRKPASYCGVVGLKPTYGTVSRYGLIAYASSLDQIGPMTKDVRDAATILEIMAGMDGKDSTSVKRDNFSFTRALNTDVNGIRIGVPKDYFGEALDEEVKKSVEQAIDILKSKGAIVEEFELGLVDYVVPTYYTIVSAEASSNLARYDGVKYGYRSKQSESLQQMYDDTRDTGFGQEVRKRIEIGNFVLSEGSYNKYYLKALKVRRLIKESFDKTFEKYDVIIGPVSPTTAPKLGESLQKSMKMYFNDIYTVSANLAGLPAISIPCGVDSKGLPIGMQIMGDRFCEDKIINVAYAYEQSQA